MIEQPGKFLGQLYHRFLTEMTDDSKTKIQVERFKPTHTQKQTRTLLDETECKRQRL